MHTAKARSFTSIISFPLISTVKSIYYKLPSFFMKKERVKKFRSLSKDTQFYAGSKSGLPCSNLLSQNFFSKSKLAPKKSESVSSSHEPTPSESLFPTDNILPSLLIQMCSKLKRFNDVFILFAQSLTNRSARFIKEIILILIAESFGD